MFFEDLSKKDVYLNLVSFFIGLTMLSMMLTIPTEVRVVLFTMSILGLIFLKGSIDLLKQMFTKYYIYLIFVLICFTSYFLNFDNTFPFKNYPEVENFFIFFISFVALDKPSKFSSFSTVFFRAS